MDTLSLHDALPISMPLPVERERFCLPPAPTGDRINHPANLVAAYAGLAEVLGMPETELRATVAANFARWCGQLET